MADIAQLKGEPDKLALQQALRGDDVLSPMEFYKMMSPKTFKDYEAADQGDRILNGLGIVTPKIKKLRDAHAEIDTTLDPLYREYKKNILEQRAYGATVGEQQALAPDLPLPPGAQRSPQELYGPGAPVPGPGGQSLMVPSQANLGQPSGPPGPMGQQGQPVGQPVDPLLPGAQSPGFTGQYQMGPDVSGWAPKGPIQDLNASQPTMLPAGQFLQQQAQKAQAQGPMVEGPRPMSPGGINDQMLLPKVFQQQLEARAGRERRYAPRGAGGERGMTPTDLLIQDRERIAEIMNGDPEAYKGELGDLRYRQYSKVAPEGTAEGATARNKAVITGANAGVADEQAQATLQNTQAGAAQKQAQTETENALRDAKLENTIANTKYALTQASTVGQKAELADKMAELQKMKFGYALEKFSNATETMSPEELDQFTNHLMKQAGVGLEFKRTEPGAIKKFFGGSGTRSLQETQPAQPAQGTNEFKDAPPGKAKGATLKKNGKAIATWDGKAWQAIR